MKAPKLLVEVVKWLAQQPGLGHFHAETRSITDLRWPKLSEDAIGFLRLPDGSDIAVLSPNSSSDEEGNPVVVFDSEGLTWVAADSLEGFLHAWSRGETGVMELNDAREEGKKALVGWLKQRCIPAPAATTAPRTDLAVRLARLA